MHVILPLILLVIVLILVVLLCVQSPRFSPPMERAIWWRAGRSPRLEGEERLLSHVEGQDSHDEQLQSPDNHTTAADDQWKLVDINNANECEAAKLRRDLSTTASQNADLQYQLEILTRDLQNARLFLTTADAYSDSEVIQMLQKLNAELQHTSTIMADCVLSILPVRDFVTLDPEVENRALECIGSTLVKAFRTVQHDDLPMYLQIAFQAYLAHHLCWIVSSFTLDKGRNTFINEIYQRLRETEKQAISARWRSLTRAYLLPSCVSEPHSVVKPVVTGLSDILSVAGCVTSQSDVIPELYTMFETKISSAVALAGRLNQMIGGVISGDFEVFVVRPGTTLEKEMMEEDTDESEDEVPETSSGIRRSHVVLCASELGLTKRVQLGTREETETETKVVVKAKVVLESFLDVE